MAKRNKKPSTPARAQRGVKRRETMKTKDGTPGSYGPNLLADSRLEIIPSMSWGGGRGRGGHHGYARLPYPNRADEGRGSGGLGGQVGRRACLYYKLTGNRGGTHTGCDEGKRKGRGVWLYSLGVCVCVFVYVCLSRAPAAALRARGRTDRTGREDFWTVS